DVDSSADDGFAVMESEDLSTRQRALRFVEDDAGRVEAVRQKCDLLERIEVARASLETGLSLDGSLNPGDVPYLDFLTIQPRRLHAIESDDQVILRQVLSDDDEMLVVGIGGNPDSAALTDRVEMKPLVPS